MSLRTKIAMARTVPGIMHGSRAFGPPYQAIVQMNAACNVRCIHCFYYSPLRKAADLNARKPEFQCPTDVAEASSDRPEAPDAERLTQTVDELMDLGTPSFLFTAKGEPFLSDCVFGLIERCKGAGRECAVNTNGLLLSRDVIDRLIDTGFDQLRITTMAGTPEMYEATHPGTDGAEFERMVDNLRYLADRKRSLGISRPEVCLVSVLVSTNYDSIMDLARLADRVRATRVWYRPFDDISNSALTTLLPTAEQQALMAYQARQAAAYLGARGIRHNVPVFLNVCNRQLDTRRLYERIPCYYGWFSTRIDLNGDVLGCCRAYEPLGNIHEQSIREIWTGPAYREFRRRAGNLHRGGPRPERTDCDRCAHAAANLRIYRTLHPVRSRSPQYRPYYDVEHIAPDITSD